MKTLYFNVESGLSEAIKAVEQTAGLEVVLVFPKQSAIFYQPGAFKTLKKQADFMQKRLFVSTMDHAGQALARDAGFELKFFSGAITKNSSHAKIFGDIRRPVLRDSAAPQVAFSSLPQSQNPFKSAHDGELETTSALNKPAANQRLVKKRLVKKPAITLSDSSKIIPNSDQSNIESNPQQANASPNFEFGKVHTIRSRDNVFTPPNQNPVVITKIKNYRYHIMAGLIGVVAITFGVITLVLPSAKVEIYTKGQVVIRDLDLTADSSVQVSNIEQLVIPAKKIDQAVNAEAVYQTLGKKEVGSKAVGKVAIFNLTGTAMNLRAATTTLTVGTKNYSFVLDQGNVQPVASASNDSGATIAEVTAQDSGESFNLPAGTRIEIDNQAFGSQPERLFAKTVSEIVGGSSRFVSVITEEDIVKAKDELIVKVVSQANADLQKEGLELVEGSFLAEVANFETDKKVGDESTVITASGVVNLKGVAFKKDEAKNLARARLLATLGSEKSLQPADKDLLEFDIRNLDLDSGMLQAAVKYETTAVISQPGQNLAQKIVGLSSDRASQTIMETLDVDKVEIKLQPSWQKNLPKLASKIKFTVLQQ